MVPNPVGREMVFSLVRMAEKSAAPVRMLIVLSALVLKFWSFCAKPSSWAAVPWAV